MALFTRTLVLTFLVVGSFATDSNPVTKVLKLLGDLKKEVVNDGKAEAKSYDKYACFCKDTTKKKSDSIIKGENSINKLSASIADNTASKEEKEQEVADRKQSHKELGSELTDTVSRCSTQQAEYEAGNADMTKAIASLNKAIKAMNAQKKAVGLPAIHAKAGKTGAKMLLELEQAAQHGLALSKLDPSDPAYKYHSKEINDILAKCLKDFQDEKKDVVDKWGKTSGACQKTKNGLNKKMKDNLDAITKAEQKIESLAKTISKDRGSLVDAQDDLNEDSNYLKSLTAQCEEKATDYDQRSSTRNDEITALSEAIKIIGNKVEDADKEVNRFFLQMKAVSKKPISFLQVAPVQAVFLDTQLALQEKVVSLLRTEGSKIGSTDLELLAMQINGPDHFAKVKNMIQSLIERLLDEEKAEISKKGFCDEELAKAMGDRDNNQRKAEGMSAELKEFEATKEELEGDLIQLAKDIKKAEDALEKAEGLRAKDKKQNEATLKTANDGLEALNEAIEVLKAFYKFRGPTVLLQADPEAGFSGDYKGNEKGSRAIFSLLDVIVADFEKTIQKTEQAEEAAQASFVKFSQETKSDIASKETKTTLNNQDLKTTKSNIAKTLDDLDTTMGLQNDALKMMESLKPACLDAGGMSSKERGNKRNEEIKALKLAICIMTPGKKEGDCK